MNKIKQFVLFTFVVFVSLYISIGGVFAQATSVRHGSLKFLVIGDWGREGKDAQQDVARSMGKRAASDTCAFVISTGDNFYERGVSSPADPQFKTSFENVYSAPSLQIPWYVSLGNHDYLTNADAQVAYTQQSKRWHMPSRYFAVEQSIDDTTSALFLIVDTSPFVEHYKENDDKYHVASQSTSNQLSWIDSVLSHSKAKWKFAAGHHPLYSAAKTHGNTPELITRMLPLFKKYHVQAFFCGHDHNLQHLHDEGIESYLSGGGATARHDIKQRPDLVFGSESTGFLEVNLTMAQLTANFYDANGTLLNTSVLKP